MSKQSEYKQALERHDDPRYTFEHYNGVSFYPCYNMSSEDMRELRHEQRNDLKQNENNYRIADRAIVIANKHGSSLKSYYTTVCAIIDGKFYKTWEGFSTTTMKHINDFRMMFNLPTLNKKGWDKLSEENGNIVERYKIEVSNGIASHIGTATFDSYEQAIEVAEKMENRLNANNSRFWVCCTPIEV